MDEDSSGIALIGYAGIINLGRFSVELNVLNRFYDVFLSPPNRKQSFLLTFSLRTVHMRPTSAVACKNVPLLCFCEGCKSSLFKGDISGVRGITTVVETWQKPAHSSSYILIVRLYPGVPELKLSTSKKVLLVETIRVIALNLRGLFTKGWDDLAVTASVEGVPGFLSLRG